MENLIERTGFVPKGNWDGNKTVARNGKRGYEDKKRDIGVPVKKSNHGVAIEASKKSFTEFILGMY